MNNVRSYEELRTAFRWRIPARYNIARDTVGRWAAATPSATALIAEDAGGSVRRYSWSEVDRASSRLANVLVGRSPGGLERGDRVAILLPQAAETAFAHLAAYKAGLIAVPLFVLFGPDALEYRLLDSGARALITDLAHWPAVLSIRDRLPDLATILVVDGRGIDGTLDYAATVGRASADFATVDTGADDPAMVSYTSGTTGPPKGALHAHRFLLGHLPGVETPHESFPQPGDVMWTPADWAWIGGLYDVLFPAWHHGVPVVARRFARFDPEAAVALMARHGVRNVFFPPTALKLLRGSGVVPLDSGVRLRTIGSGGETLGGELLDWGRTAFGVTINEFYGQTEANLLVSNCAAIMPIRPGSMGRAVPGHDVAIVTEAGDAVPIGEPGIIAVRRPDPVMFLGYWNQPAATEGKFAGDWLLTGDTGRQDEAGYFWFGGRTDDVITTAGYRVGPGEIEDCLLRHSAVAMAAVVGVPDPIRTEAIKAFVVLRPGYAGGDNLTREIQEWVRTRLAAHEYPRIVEFVDELPLTATGKIIRRELRNRG